MIVVVDEMSCEEELDIGTLVADEDKSPMVLVLDTVLSPPDGDAVGDAEERVANEVTDWLVLVESADTGVLELVTVVTDAERLLLTVTEGLLIAPDIGVEDPDMEELEGRRYAAQYPGVSTICCGTKTIIRKH